MRLTLFLRENIGRYREGQLDREYENDAPIVVTFAGEYENRVAVLATFAGGYENRTPVVLISVPVPVSAHHISTHSF